MFPRNVPKEHLRSALGRLGVYRGSARPRVAFIIMRIMSLRAQLMELRPEILRIAAEHGARNVRLFGSVARGEDGPESDLDLLVTFDPDRSLMDHAALVEALQDLLGRPVEIANERGIKPRFRHRILSEAVVL